MRTNLLLALLLLVACASPRAGPPVEEVEPSHIGWLFMWGPEDPEALEKWMRHDHDPCDLCAAEIGSCEEVVCDE